MKLLALSLCALVALCSASRFEEDETEVLSSPFHQHASDFMSKFQSFLSSNPTGRPYDNKKMLHSHYKKAYKALAAQRPTGRPFRPHKERSEHNHATWKLRDNYRKAQSALLKYHWSQIMKARQAAKDAKAAAAAVLKDADETEIISSPFLVHASGFKQHLDNLFSNRPTGRPNFKEVLKGIFAKHAEAKANLKSSKPTGRPSRKEKNQYSAANRKLNLHLGNAQHKVDLWKEQVRKEQWKAKIAASPLGTHVAGFKQHIDDSIAKSGNAPPTFQDFMKGIRAKYNEVKANMLALRPTGRPSYKDRNYFKHANSMLKGHMSEAAAKARGWQAQQGEKKPGEVTADDVDETEVLSSPFRAHADGFKQHIDNLFANRPTGRPDFKQHWDSLHNKYVEAKTNLWNSWPTGRPSPDQHKQYRDAENELRGHKKDADNKMYDWAKQVKQEEWDAKMVGSPFHTHADGFKQHIDNLLASRPTGRPDFKQHWDSLNQKYHEAKTNLWNSWPTGRPAENQHDQYKDAEWRLRDSYNKAHSAIRKLRWDQFVKERAAAKAAAASAVEDEDETEILSSPFQAHPDGFKQHFDNLFANPPTGRPDFKQHWDSLHNKYEEAKTNLWNSWPTGRPAKDQHKQYKDAEHELKEHKKDAENKMYDWEKQVKQEQWEAKMAASPFRAHADGFKQHFDNLFANKPTGRPDFKQYWDSVHHKYEEAKTNLWNSWPTGRPAKHQNDQYKDAEKRLKEHKKDAENKVYAWEKEVKEQQKQDALAASPFGVHVDGFKKHVDSVMMSHPSGPPSFKDFMYNIHKKYEEAKQNMHDSKPTGRPSKEDKYVYKHAQDALWNHMSEAEQKVKAWKHQVEGQKKHDKHYHESKKHGKHHYESKKHGKYHHDEDETEIISSPFKVHVDGFKQDFDNMFASRPTGRPDFDQYWDSVEDRFDEYKAKLRASKPTGRPNPQYKQAVKELKQHLEDAEDQVDDWEDQVKDAEKQAKIAASPFGTHVSGFKDHLDGLMASNPNGPPSFDDFMNAIKNKYREVKDQMKAARPIGAPLFKKAYKHAKDALKDHKEDAEDKVKAWKKQMDKQAEEDETEVISSPFHIHAENFRGSFSDLFSKRPTGRPSRQEVMSSAKKYMNAIERFYKESRNKMRKVSKKNKNKKTFKSANQQLQSDRNDSQEKVKAWRRHMLNEWAKWNLDLHAI